MGVSSRIFPKCFSPSVILGKSKGGGRSIFLAAISFPSLTAATISSTSRPALRSSGRRQGQGRLLRHARGAAHEPCRRIEDRPNRVHRITMNLAAGKVVNANSQGVKIGVALYLLGMVGMKFCAVTLYRHREPLVCACLD